MQPAIAVRELTKTYAEGSAKVPALRGIDLEVRSGELLTLVGPSGSGKSSVIQAGLVPLLRCQLPPARTWRPSKMFMNRT